MGPAAAIVPVVLGIASAGLQYIQGQKAAKAAEEVAAANAARAAAETAESARRLKKQQEATLAEQRARSAASGVQSTGSQLAWMQSEEEEAGLELSWLKKAGRSQQNLLTLQGQQASMAASAAGTSGALSSFSSGLNTGFNWYKAL